MQPDTGAATSYSNTHVAHGRGHVGTLTISILGGDDVNNAMIGYNLNLNITAINIKVTHVLVTIYWSACLLSRVPITTRAGAGP